MKDQKEDIRQLSLEQLTDTLTELGEKPFRAKKAIPGPEHNAKTENDETHGGHGGVHQVFGHDVDDIFGPYKPGFEKAKPCLHEKDEEGSDEHPHRIDGAYHRFALLGKGSFSEA